MCKAHADELLLESKEEIDYLGTTSLFQNTEIANSLFQNLDSILTQKTEQVLGEHEGLEGGFYFFRADKFAGYSYPTSPSPIPVYGPPPRSYNIIKEQCLKAINENNSILELHGFDPALFPLMTIPISYQNEIIGAIWVRIHIERELPLIKLQSVINIATGFLIVILIFVLWGFYTLRTKIQSIRDEIEKINLDPEYRLQNHGQLFSVIVSSINLTLEKLRSGNQERRDLEYKLLQREKMASIGRIVAGVAHEVRTPLAIIKTRIQMWQQALKENQETDNNHNVITADTMELVVNETNRLSNLIKRLLILSRPINKKMVKTNLVEQIKETVKILQIQKGITNIEFKINEVSIPTIIADSNSTQQVFLNIISNSMEAMPDGGTITINFQAIEENSKIRIEILDEGSGIPEQIFDKMFELFITSKPTGVGLGLSISNEIMKAHSGKIFFENREERGAKCTILLPVAQKQN
ncbi:MAG: hypothetical protein JW729_07310 [Bacteroidales bacterium]|nr:hypothetical protein [Bacteroidales bacterium]